MTLNYTIYNYPCIDNLMQQQQLPLNKARLTNLIRSTTASTLQPIIGKLQQHIAQLLAQSNTLREQNLTLELTVADHASLRQALSEAREDLGRIDAQMAGARERAENEKEKIMNEIVRLDVDVEKIINELRRKETRLGQLGTRLATNEDRIGDCNREFMGSLEHYASEVNLLKTDNKRISTQFTMLQQYVEQSIGTMTGRLDDKQSQLAEIKQHLHLYLTQREQSRQFVQGIWAKVDKAVDIDKYEADWRIIRLENQQTRRRNQKMIDDALTPDVREFLPEMMQRISEVRKVNELERVVREMAADRGRVEGEHRHRIAQLQKMLKQTEVTIGVLEQQLKQQNKQIVNQMRSQMQRGTESTTSALQFLTQTTTSLIQDKQRELRSELQALISKNQQSIYDVVVNLIPEEQKQFYNRMKDFIPLLEATKTEILDRCDQITEFGRRLEERLDGFNNRIVKTRGDMQVEIDALKKKNKGLDGAITVINDNFKVVGKVISMYCELFLINFSLGLEQAGQQVYVTLSDGIVCEGCRAEGEICYRRNQYPKDQMRKSTMVTLMKLLDWMINQPQYSFLSMDTYRPSELFKLIRQSMLLNTSTPLMRPGSGKKLDPRRSSLKIKESSADVRLPSLEYNPSKTIDFTNHETIMESPTLTPTLNLGASLSTSKNRQRASYRGRYSQLK